MNKPVLTSGGNDSDEKSFQISQNLYTYLTSIVVLMGVQYGISWTHCGTCTDKNTSY